MDPAEVDKRVCKNARDPLLVKRLAHLCGKTSFFSVDGRTGRKSWMHNVTGGGGSVADIYRFSKVMSDLRKAISEIGNQRPPCRHTLGKQINHSPGVTGRLPIQ